MSLVQPITPHLWFDTQSREAVEFYTSVFPRSRIDSIVQLRDTPSGDCDVVSFTLCGQPFMAISAGPLFKFNASVSFMVNFDPSRDAQAREHLNAVWAALIDGGEALMPLDAYLFSHRYGWLRDRFGLQWQLILTDSAGEPRPDIMPSLLFTGAVCGEAEASGAFYRGVFDGSRAGQIAHCPEGVAADRAARMMFSDFCLDGTWFVAMDNAHPHRDAGFNEAVSFVVTCRDQAEIDRYWAQLSSVPEAEQCGWCKDRFGLSWQITPQVLGAFMTSGDQVTIDRVTRAFLPMHKLDVAAIEAAGHGE